MRYIIKHWQGGQDLAGWLQENQPYPQSQESSGASIAMWEWQLAAVITTAGPWTIIWELRRVR
jgi:hypothetical protein